MKENLIEMVGYAGSLLVLVSFLMTSVVKLRIVNTIGSLIFMIYALIIKSYPTAIMNFCLVLINLRFLWKLTSMGKEYELVHVGSDEALFKWFINYYRQDIMECFPGIDLDFPQDTEAIVINCEGKPVGLTVYRTDSNTRELLLDYTIPQFRDFSIGEFQNRIFAEEGIKKLIYRGPTENHAAYLDRMGYHKKDGYYELDL